MKNMGIMGWEKWDVASQKNSIIFTFSNQRWTLNTFSE